MIAVTLNTHWWEPSFLDGICFMILTFSGLIFTIICFLLMQVPMNKRHLVGKEYLAFHHIVHTSMLILMLWWRESSVQCTLWMTSTGRLMVILICKLLSNKYYSLYMIYWCLLFLKPNESSFWHKSMDVLFHGCRFLAGPVHLYLVIISLSFWLSACIPTQFHCCQSTCEQIWFLFPHNSLFQYSEVISCMNIDTIEQDSLHIITLQYVLFV